MCSASTESDRWFDCRCGRLRRCSKANGVRGLDRPETYPGAQDQAWRNVGAPKAHVDVCPARRFIPNRNSPKDASSIRFEASRNRLWPQMTPEYGPSAFRPSAPASRQYCGVGLGGQQPSLAIQSLQVLCGPAVQHHGPTRDCRRGLLSEGGTKNYQTTWTPTEPAG